VHVRALDPSATQPRSLRQRFVGTAEWAVAGDAIAQALHFVSNLILTRLLAPDIFGVMSVTYMVFYGMAMLSDLGLSAIVSRSPRGDEPRFLNVVWVLQNVQGALIAVVTLVLSGLLALEPVRGLFLPNSVYADRRLPMLIAAMSICGIVSGLQSTRVHWARRNLSIGPLTRMELGCQVATTVFIVMWAWIAPSAWALVAGWIFAQVIRTAASHLVLPGPPNRFEWERAAFQEIMAFGRWALMSSPLSFLLTSGDRLLLGALLGAQEMGLYSIAVLLVVALQNAVLKVLGTAAVPAMREVLRERPAELRQKIYRMQLPLAAACLVPAGALFMLGDNVVRILYDSRYSGAGWMLSALSLTLAVTHLNLIDQCLIALGRMKRLAALNGIRAVTLYALVGSGYAFFGSRGAILAIPAAAIVNAALALAVQKRLGLLDGRRELAALPLFAVGVTAGWLLRLALP